MRYPRFALVSVPAAWGQPQPELVVHFVEIGQGDCTLIRCPNGTVSPRDLRLFPSIIAQDIRAKAHAFVM